jgi:hypothetical protein
VARKSPLDPLLLRVVQDDVILNFDYALLNRAR